MSDWLAAPDGPVELDDNEIDVWLFHLNTSPHRIKHFYPLLSDEEKERSEKLIHFIHRKRFISSHGYSREVLARYLDTTADKLEFGRSEHGKPFLQQKGQQSDIKFNLSHSHNMAILGICRQNELGIDIEYMNRKNNWRGIIKRFFTEDEQKSIFSLPETEQQKAFFMAWTRKEAHMKVTGQGLHLSPTQFTVSIPPEPAKLISYTKAGDINPDKWSMSDIRTPDVAKDYCACLSCYGKILKINYFLHI